MPVTRRLLLAGSGSGSFILPGVSALREALYNGTIDGGTTYAIGAATFDGATWTKDAGNPLITKGAGGTWDQHGVKDPWLVWTGSGYVAYYAGYTYSGADAQFRIGRATASSLSGPWTKDAGNPVLTVGAGGSADATDVQAPIVYYNPAAIGGHAWWMWYTGTASGGAVSAMLAHSDDGITWTKDGSVSAMGPVVYIGGTFYMIGGGNWALWTFTTPTGTYTAYGGNPIHRPRSADGAVSTVLTANASAGATTLTVGAGTAGDLLVGEPLFIVDANSGPEVKKVTSVGSTSIGVTALTNSYQTADGATIRPLAYTFMDQRSLLRMSDGTWEAFGTAFRPGDGLAFSGHPLWEGSLRLTAPAPEGPWSYDLTTGLIFPLTSLGAAWDSVSAENMSVIVAP